MLAVWRSRPMDEMPDSFPVTLPAFPPKELDQLVAMHGNRVSAYHILNSPPASGWQGGSGFITKATIAERFPPPGECIHLLLG